MSGTPSAGLGGRWQRMQARSPVSGHFLVTAGSNIAIALLTLVTGMIAARILGPSGRGELAAIQTWAPFVGTMAMLGLTDALVFFSAREPQRAGRYTGSASALALLSSLPFFVAGYLVMPYLLAAQSVEVVQAARRYLLLIPIWAVVWMPLNALRGRSEMVSWNALRLAQTLAWLTVLLVALGAGQASAAWITGAHLLAMLALAIPVFAVVARRIPGPFLPDSTTFRPLLGYGIPAIAGTIPQLLNSRVDQLLMAAFLPPRVLGLYVVGVAWSSAAGPLITAIGNVVFPRVAVQATKEERVRTLMQATRVSGVVSVALGLVLLVGTPVAIPLLFGREFLPAIPAALILVVAGMFGGVNNVLGEAARGYGEPKLVLWSEGVGLLVAAVSLALLLPTLGIVGAALASLISYAATSVVLAKLLARAGGCTVAAILVPGRSDAELVVSRIRMALRG